jgi:hypothetical protein
MPSAETDVLIHVLWINAGRHAEGYRSGSGDDPATGRAITTSEWLDRLAPGASGRAVRAPRLGRAARGHLLPGATASTLPAGTGLPDPQSDVEAVLVHDDEAYLVPIDVCYELAGRPRKVWCGFDGGCEAREEISRLFTRVQERSARGAITVSRSAPTPWTRCPVSAPGTA